MSGLGSSVQLIKAAIANELGAAGVDREELIEALNEIKQALHEVSPFRAEPVDCVLWVKAEPIRANDYNPNDVAPPEMRLLERSVLADGFTQPVVTWLDGADREVVDGFHRRKIAARSVKIRKRLGGYLPVTTLGADRHARGDRMAATVRHNRARGKHTVEGMSGLVMELTRRNWSPKRIGKELGMDADEVLRMKQITGLAEMFADREFSEAWEAA